MISFKRKEVGPNLQSFEPIQEFKIMWLTHRGQTDSLDEAVQLCVNDGLEPDASIRPVVVAVGDCGYTELIG